MYLLSVNPGYQTTIDHLTGHHALLPVALAYYSHRIVLWVPTEALVFSAQ